MFRPEQSVFRRGRSCIEQIHTLRRLIEGFYKKQLPLVSTFADFKKAFDSVDRNKMSQILRHYGIPPKITSAIMILYSNSRSRIRINGKTSKAFDVTKSVLQGDTLAPFLFIIVFDYVLRQTESGNYGVQTHPDKILTDLHLEDDIVLLDENSESAVRLSR